MCASHTITVWVVSKNESNCLVENKVVSALGDHWVLSTGLMM